jgi:drug/metabolite transporter (DMT)-like permease
LIRKLLPYIQFLFVCGVWGSSFILMKRATLAFSPAAVGFGRIASGAVVLAIVWSLAQDRKCTKWQSADLAGLLFVALVGYAWPFTLQPWLVAQYGSAFIGMQVAFVPLLTLMVSIPLLRHWPTTRQVIGVVGALVCLCGLMYDGWKRSIPVSHLALSLSVPIAYAFTNTWIRRSMSHIGTLDLTMRTLGVASIGLLPVMLVTAGPSQPTSEEWWVAIAALGFLGCVGTGAATFVFNRLIQQHGPLFAGMVTNLVPLGAVVWGWADSEQVTPLQLAALAGILFMVAVVQYGAAHPPPQQPASPQTPPPLNAEIPEETSR